MAEKQVSLKVYKVRNGGLMIAACNCDLLGKTFKDGKLVLDISKEFYGGEKVAAEAAIDMLRVATVANLVGEDAIRCGIAAGLIHKECVIMIGGIPHAQFVLI